MIILEGECDVNQAVQCPPVKVEIILSILLSGPLCGLDYVPLQPVVHNCYDMTFHVWENAYKRALAAYWKE